MIYQVLFILIPLVYFFYYFYKYPEKSSGNGWRDFADFFGFNNPSYSALKKGLLLAGLLIIVFFVIGITYSYIYPDSTDSVGKVIIAQYKELGMMYIVFMFFGVLIEEFFFRAFLVDRFGIFFSTALFALMHYAYGSWYEIFGAFVLGLIIALFWQRDRDYWIVTIGHILYNLFIIVLILW